MGKFMDVLREKEIIVGDGAMGTGLQQMGLTSGEAPEKWNLTHPDRIQKIHQNYIKAGAQLIETNTFGGSYIRLEEAGLEKDLKEINQNAVQIAQKAANSDTIIAGSVGPTGKMIKPLGNLDPEEVIHSYTKQISVLVKSGIDVIIIETMVDINEIKAALEAASQFDIPVIAQMNFEESLKTVMGCTLDDLINLTSEFENIKVIGVNCTPGAVRTVPLIEKLNKKTEFFLSVFPNAGEPELKEGEVYYPEGPENFVPGVKSFIDNKVKIIGGCCGTTPEIIKAVSKTVKNN
ncbi:MAG: homocysteine S-methyltransferase family protein [Bacillota bacterium]